METRTTELPASATVPTAPEGDVAVLAFDTDRSWAMSGSASASVWPAVEGDILVMRHGDTLAPHAVRVPEDVALELDMQPPKPDTLPAHGLLSPGNAVLATAG